MQTKEAALWITHPAKEAEDEGRFSGGLPAGIQLDIVDVDSIELRKQVGATKAEPLNVTRANGGFVD